MREADETLGERLKTAERFSIEMQANATAGVEVLNRLSRIAGAQVRPDEQAQAEPVPDARSIVAAAAAFTERTRRRVRGMAA